MSGDQLLRAWYLLCGILILLCALGFASIAARVTLIVIGVVAVSVATYWEEIRRLRWARRTRR